MFTIQFASWVLLSLILVGVHIYTTASPHARVGLTVLTAILWGLAGGVLGLVIRMSGGDGGRPGGLPLLLAGVATTVYLFVEWAGSHDHPRRTVHR